MSAPDPLTRVAGFASLQDLPHTISETRVFCRCVDGRHLVKVPRFARRVGDHEVVRRVLTVDGGWQG